MSHHNADLTQHLPRFSDIDPNQIVSELKAHVQHNRAEIDKHLAQKGPYTWDNFMAPLESLDNTLNNFWAPISHLHNVCDSKSLRDAYNACMPILSDYHSGLSHHKPLFEAIQSIAERDDVKTLTAAQQKVIHNQLRDFKLAGIALPKDKQKTFAELTKALTQSTTQFEENVLDATMGWFKHITDETELAGLPTHAIDAAAQKAQQKNLSGWVFTLEFPLYSPVMSYADSPALRREMYEAYTTRASDRGPNAKKWDNTPVMHDILKNRLALVRLLDFQHYAERSLATKMVETPQQVLDFLTQLVEASLPKAKAEYDALCEFARIELGLASLNAWDIAYVSEKLRQARYAISQEDLRPYFPEYKVIAGLFSIVKKLFGVDIQEINDFDRYHPDVRCFVVYDQSGALQSFFYLDLYARENKRGGAWMDDCRIRRRDQQGNLQYPVAFINCNFNRPVGDQPALFTHDEVVTLFHEFGHGLQHMLTRVEHIDVSGINGVPWDAVEIASQFLEHWTWEKASIPYFSEHYLEKTPLPDDLFEKMLRAKNFHAAMMMVRQLEFALFDFRLHIEFDPEQENQIQHILDEVRQAVRVVPVGEFDRFQHGFGHIFAGGYAAGYYSYKWAEVMASDAFSLFLEKGIFDANTSQKFLETFLQTGGVEDPMTLFVAFRGRAPSVEGLLKASGIL